VVLDDGSIYKTSGWSNLDAKMYLDKGGRYVYEATIVNLKFRREYRTLGVFRRESFLDELSGSVDLIFWADKIYMILHIDALRDIRLKRVSASFSVEDSSVTDAFLIKDDETIHAGLLDNTVFEGTSIETCAFYSSQADDVAVGFMLSNPADFEGVTVSYGIGVARYSADLYDSDNHSGHMLHLKKEESLTAGFQVYPSLNDHAQVVERQLAWERNAVNAGDYFSITGVSDNLLDSHDNLEEKVTVFYDRYRGFFNITLPPEKDGHRYLRYLPNEYTWVSFILKNPTEQLQRIRINLNKEVNNDLILAGTPMLRNLERE
jgi:hypothetical protein